MWAKLTDPAHAERFDDPGDAAMRRLVLELAQRPYAGELFAHKSMATLILTAGASQQKAAEHDEITIRCDPRRGLFEVAYCEWVSPTRSPPHREAAGRSCEAAEVVEVVDRYVVRLLLAKRG
jgi:hypothetical protein